MSSPKSKYEYDVIIVGGGPVGIALGIELGMQNVKTLIIEKHDQPLRTPRAQSLSARTMEFFLRWGVDKALEESLLLKDLPQTGVWCESLRHEPYFISCWGDNKLAANVSPKAGVRVPLWITEKILRARIQDFPSVKFIKNHEVHDIQMNADDFLVQSYDKVTHSSHAFHARYVACCDGATGMSKNKFNNTYTPLSEKTKMLATLFTSSDIMQKKSSPDSIMYFVMSENAMAFFGPIDLKEKLWLAQLVWNDPELLPTEALLSNIIDNIVGAPIQKKIESYTFWDMQVQLANFFSLDQRIFWVGDAAHAFAPTGGLGLNTGFGDAQNLGWKLASVIKHSAPDALLSTYERERLPICLNNLNFAKQNAEEFVKIKQQFSPSEDLKAFVTAYAELGNRFLSSSGLTMGYQYTDPVLTQLTGFTSDEVDPFHYTPRIKPGYFLPHAECDGKPIYQQLSATAWNVIMSDAEEADIVKDEIAQQLGHRNIHLMQVPEKTYPYSYLLVRPDWHIARVGNTFASISGHLWESPL